MMPDGPKLWKGGRNPVNPAIRFLNKFVLAPDGCWEWTAGLTSSGHAAFKYPGGNSGYRFAYQQLYGAIPKGYSVHHVCRNTRCVNPFHLMATEHRHHILDLHAESIFAINARKTHCPQGHPYDSENTIYGPKGKRYCRICHRAHQRAADRKRSGKTKRDKIE
jgi:hypothetical protein